METNSKMDEEKIKEYKEAVETLKGDEKTRKVLLHMLKSLSEKRKEAEKAREAVLHMLIGVTKARREAEAAKVYTDNIIKSMIDTLIVVDPDAKIRTLNFCFIMKRYSGYLLTRIIITQFRSRE